jgi:hypothetical protein
MVMQGLVCGGGTLTKIAAAAAEVRYSVPTLLTSFWPGVMMITSKYLIPTAIGEVEAQAVRQHNGTLLLDMVAKHLRGGTPTFSGALLTGFWLLLCSKTFLGKEFPGRSAFSCKERLGRVG